MSRAFHPSLGHKEFLSSLLFSAQTQSQDLTNATETLMFRNLSLQILNSDLASVLS